LQNAIRRSLDAAVDSASKPANVATSLRIVQMVTMRAKIAVSISYILPKNKQTVLKHLYNYTHTHTPILTYKYVL